ncbi:MAG TPA: lamin tail domain-containing protein, partial [Verrucomicrobiae bacterium]
MMKFLVPGENRRRAGPGFLTSLAVAVAFLGLGTCAGRADSVVVFNEIMHHPLTNESVLEWVELHNQMAVNVDLSGWSLAGGIDYKFAEGTVIPGGGYLVVAISPPTLMGATGLTNVLGPFVGRLSNSGEKLELRNNNGRLMDSVSYGVDGDWPVAADGSGVSLAKRDEDAASAVAASWTVSAFVGGTPGRRNFSPVPFETTTFTPVLFGSTWKFDASGSDPDAEWKETAFNDGGWASGNGLFQAGEVTVPLGAPEPVPTVFNTGVGANGSVLPPGAADPHYQLVQSAQSAPPPPPIAATVIQNHPAWVVNDPLSSWIGPINPGTTSVAAGSYQYRTRFSLDGFSPASARITMNIGVDDRLSDVLLNGASKGIASSGFAALTGDLRITDGFVPGTNTVDFLTVNEGTDANPAGFRVKMSGSANRVMTPQTAVPTAATTYFFRTTFALGSEPQVTSARLNAVVADGAVVYLNGFEVLRLNMPEGSVTPATPAVTNVPAPSYVGPFILPSASLLKGTNLLAIEVHQGPGGNDGILFGAELSLQVTNILVPPPVPLAFNEVSPATNAGFWLELINHGSTAVDLAGCVLTRRGATNSSHFFPPQLLGPGEFVQVTAETLGFCPEAGDRLFLYAPGNSNVLDGLVVKAEPYARYPDGMGRWCTPAFPTPASSNVFAFRDELVFNEIMYHPPGLPAVPAMLVSDNLLSITNGWKYHSLGQDLG